MTKKPYLTMVTMVGTLKVDNIAADAILEGEAALGGKIRHFDEYACSVLLDCLRRLQAGGVASLQFLGPSESTTGTNLTCASRPFPTCNSIAMPRETSRSGSPSAWDV
jgi:hypothetical protein